MIKMKIILLCYYVVSERNSADWNETVRRTMITWLLTVIIITHGIRVSFPSTTTIRNSPCILYICITTWCVMNTLLCRILTLKENYSLGAHSTQKCFPGKKRTILHTHTHACNCNVYIILCYMNTHTRCEFIKCQTVFISV